VTGRRFILLQKSFTFDIKVIVLKPISAVVDLEAFLLERIPRDWDEAVDENLAHGHKSWKVLVAY